MSDAVERRVAELYPRIAGSRLLRAFCARCGEPIRVTPSAAYESAKGSVRIPFHCEQCDPQHQPQDKGAVLTERQRSCLGRTRS